MNFLVKSVPKSHPIILNHLFAIALPQCFGIQSHLRQEEVPLEVPPGLRLSG